MRVIYNLLVYIVILLSPLIIIYRIFKKKENPKRFLEKFSINKRKRVSGKLIFKKCLKKIRNSDHRVRVKISSEILPEKSWIRYSLRVTGMGKMRQKTALESSARTNALEISKYSIPGFSARQVAQLWQYTAASELKEPHLRHFMEYFRPSRWEKIRTIQKNSLLQSSGMRP